MRIHFAVVPIAALTLALGSFSAEAAQRGERRTRSGEAQARQDSRGSSSARARDDQDRGNRSRAEARREGNASPARQRNQRADRPPDRSRQRADTTSPRRNDQADRDAATNRAVPRGSVERSRNPRVDQRDSRDRGRTPRVDSRRNHDWRAPRHRRNEFRHYAPRLIPRWSAPRRYYGPGGGLSLYFGWGSGYRYGSIYTGRVYGYRDRVISGYGPYRYYGDLRLKVSPRHAAVYVDGYYAGIVDDFDGFFQRLTVEVGPHVIEIDAPGLEPQVFDVYVDGSRTIDLHANLFR